MRVNTELAARIYRQITMHPETHDQEVVVEGLGWLPDGNVCGTTACVAGWACAFAGRLTERRSITGHATYAEYSGDWFEDGMVALGISDGLADALFAAKVPEGTAREAVRLLAISGGSEAPAAYLLEEHGGM